MHGLLMIRMTGSETLEGNCPVSLLYATAPGMSSPKVPGWPTGFPTGCACRVTTGFPTPQGRGEPHGHPWKRPVDNPWMWPQGCAPQGKCCGVGRACCTLLGRFIEIFIFCLYAQERQNTEKEALYAAHRRRIGCGRRGSRGWIVLPWRTPLPLQF